MSSNVSEIAPMFPDSVDCASVAAWSHARAALLQRTTDTSWSSLAKFETLPLGAGHLFFKNGLTQQLAMEGQGPVGTTGWCHSLSWTPEGQTHPFGQRISRDPSDVF